MTAPATSEGLKRDLVYSVLLEAAKRVLAELNARIAQAPMGQAPIFFGIADLHDAIRQVEALRHD